LKLEQGSLTVARSRREKITDRKIGNYKRRKSARLRRWPLQRRTGAEDTTTQAEAGATEPVAGHWSLATSVSVANCLLRQACEARVTNHDACLIWYSKERSKPELIRYGSAAILLRKA